MTSLRTLTMTVFCTGLGLVGVAQAQTVVAVQLGPAVQARAGELGGDELGSEQRYLEQAVRHALAKAPGRASRVTLTIVDIQPNRPTSHQLGASASLSEGGSIGLGGAAIIGEVVGPDGMTHPIRYRFFPRTLAEETNFTMWGDAEEAFDDVAHDIAAGHPPDDERTWPTPRAPAVPTGTRLPD